MDGFGPFLSSLLTYTYLLEPTVTAVNPNCLWSPSSACFDGIVEPRPPSMIGMSFFGSGFVVWVLVPCQSTGTHNVVVFSLRQQSPYPVAVHQTGGGVEWDHWAASTNLFLYAAWLMSPVGAQLLPASGMYPLQLSKEFLLGSSILLSDGQHQHLMQLIKGVAGWLVGWMGYPLHG